MADLEDSHGTGMAALIASNGSGTGHVGVAPEAKMMPVAANSTNWGRHTGGGVDGQGAGERAESRLPALQARRQKE